MESRLPHIEALESRIAPAILVNPNTVTYHDIDGDLVTVKFKNLSLTLEQANALLQFDAGTVFGPESEDTTPQSLQLITFAGLTGINNVGITVTAKLVVNGDGFAHVGAINATGIDLGVVSIKGDLGQIDAGDATLETAGVKALNVHSMGRYGLATQEPGGSLQSSIAGRIGTLTVKTDVIGAFIDVIAGNDPSEPVVGIGALAIGGSLVGGAEANTGHIRVAGSIGNVKIGGDVLGGTASDTGKIEASWGSIGTVTIGGSLQGGLGILSGSARTGMIFAGENIGAVKVGQSVVAGSFNHSGKIFAGNDISSVTIGRDLVGGEGAQTDGPGRAGQIEARNSIGALKVGGSIIGGSGASSASIYAGAMDPSEGKMGSVTVGGDVRGVGIDSANIFSEASIASVSIKGSLIGGSLRSGAIVAQDSLGPVTIGGDLRGGSAEASGVVKVTLGSLKALTIGGSVIGGSGARSGAVEVLGKAGTVKIGGSVIGNAEYSGHIHSFFFSTVTIGGSLIGGVGVESGRILAGTSLQKVTIAGDIIAGSANLAGSLSSVGSLGTVFVKGSVIGTSENHATISAIREKVGNANNIAIKSLFIGGNAVFADIIGGALSIDAPAGQTKNGDATLGTITIGRDFIASSIVAGATPGANGYGSGDTPLTGATDAIASIARVTIGGQASGTTSAVNSTDHYGIVAEQVKALTIGGVSVPLQSGPSNDDRPLGITGDLRVHEI